MTDNKQIKAIIMDLDRTLLHTDKTISDYSISILKKCRERGIRIMAASARPLRDILIYRDLIEFDAITATNGAVVLLPNGVMEIGLSCQSGEVILTRLLSFEDVILSIETSKGLYANKDIPEWHPIVYDQFPQLPKGCILYKVLASSKHKGLYEGIQDVLTDDVYYTVAGGELIQILSCEATKWKGIMRMLAYFDIRAENAACFGDDNDDIESIQKCGLGVAVANAIEAVKAVSNVITESNDMDGVARFIEKHILSE